MPAVPSIRQIWIKFAVWEVEKNMKNKPGVPLTLNWVYPVTFGSLRCRNDAMKASSTSFLLTLSSLREISDLMSPTIGVTIEVPNWILY